jgi:hypothetical protein
VTHDELLAIIEKVSLVSCDQTIDILEKIIPCGECLVCIAMHAFREVIMLHKPMELPWGFTEFGCEGCGNLYPCRTISVIQKEMTM